MKNQQLKLDTDEEVDADVEAYLRQQAGCIKLPYKLNVTLNDLIRLGTQAWIGSLKAPKASTMYQS